MINDTVIEQKQLKSKIPLLEVTTRACRVMYVVYMNIASDVFSGGVLESL